MCIRDRGRTVGIHELHMEEDAGKLIHDPWTEQTKIDYNRCGVPQMCIRDSCWIPRASSP